MTARTQVEDTLRRIEELVQGLDRVKDPAARQVARQLFAAVLDLHGLALAKITARLVADPQGRDLYQDMGEDEQIRAVLLLYGLHPDSAEQRVRAQITPLEARLDVRLHLSSVSDGIARLTLDPGTGDFDALCPEIGRVLLDAAPDLDDIAIDRAASAGVTMTEPSRAAAAG
ncbi:MAG TPA: hypothetical protein VHV26_15390 [Rhizomicrobium sp.]|nr:hypothetical protein [Rhizomicrobium sp.]